MGEKKAYIMMGIQGSGKTTFCARFLPDTKRVNLDTLHTRPPSGMYKKTTVTIV